MLLFRRNTHAEDGTPRQLTPAQVETFQAEGFVAHLMSSSAFVLAEKIVAEVRAYEKDWPEDHREGGMPEWEIGYSLGRLAQVGLVEVKQA